MTEVQARVQRTIDRLVESGQETGIQVAAYKDGRLVANAWAGAADPSTGRPVDEQTLIHSYSAGKGVTATVAHLLAARGALDYDTPLAHHWPEFAAHGKERVTLRHALTHSAGVPQLPADITAEQLYDWDAMCATVADQEPLWEPGTATGYHGWTFGWLVGETVRRATGRSISQVLREEVAGPLGVADSLFLAVPEQALPRVATLVEGNWEAYLASIPQDLPFLRSIPNRGVWTTTELANRPEYLRAELPAAGTFSASAVARMYAALIGEVDGVRLLPPEHTARITALATDDTDLMFGHPIAKGLGYFLGLPETGGRLTAFGHQGSGGSIAFADPEHGLAIAILHTRLTGGQENTGPQTVADEIRTTLGITA